MAPSTDVVAAEFQSVALPDESGPDPATCVPDWTLGNAFVRFFREGEWYFSYGYNKDYWAPTDIHVSQPAQANDFTIHDVLGHDNPGWDKKLFDSDLFGPQNNFRIGRFIDDERTIALELSLDHTKYETTVGQTAHVTGTIAGAPTDANYLLDDSFFHHKLHNGANHVMVNAVYRLPLIGRTNETLSVAAIGKAGVGLMVPHTSNVIMGHESYVGEKVWGNLLGTHSGWWQLDGWTTGLEVGFRIVLFAPMYMELTDKVAYSDLSDLPAYEGTVRHSLWMNEIILTVGFTYDGVPKFGQP